MGIRKKIGYFINPDFLEKSSIFESIEYLLNKYKNELKNKKLLDVGCGSKPYESIFEKLGIVYQGIDFKDFSPNYSYDFKSPDFCFDKSYRKNYKLSRFEDESYDIVTAFQVLEHHEKPEMFFSEVSRILKKRGCLLLSFPFIWELHEEPNDFQRLTHYKIEKYCRDNHLEILETIKRGSSLSVISQLMNLSLFNSKLFAFFKRIIYYFIFFPLQAFSYIWDKISISKNKKVFLGYTILAQKL